MRKQKPWEKYRALFHVASLIITLMGIFAAAAIAMNDVKRHETSIMRLEKDQSLVERRLIRVDNNIEILMRYQKLKPLPPVE